MRAGMDDLGSAPPTAADDAALPGLMVRYQRGEMEAFEELYRRTLPMVRGYLVALTRDATRAADLVQECYLRMHRSRHTYDPAFPVKPWLLGIARHVRLVDRRRRWLLLSRETAGLDALPELPVPAEMEGWADRDALMRALAQLPADRREAIVLHHIYGLSFREIGRVVGVSEGGARIRASRGMSELREKLVPGGRRG
jgi:RNA polymerase sigma-70 factor (ECF subfamily)